MFVCPWHKGKTDKNPFRFSVSPTLVKELSFFWSVTKRKIYTAHSCYGSYPSLEKVYISLSSLSSNRGDETNTASDWTTMIRQLAHIPVEHQALHHTLNWAN